MKALGSYQLWILLVVFIGSLEGLGRSTSRTSRSTSRSTSTSSSSRSSGSSSGSSGSSSRSSSFVSSSSATSSHGSSGSWLQSSSSRSSSSSASSSSSSSSSSSQWEKPSIKGGKVYVDPNAGDTGPSVSTGSKNTKNQKTYTCVACDYCQTYEFNDNTASTYQFNCYSCLKTRLVSTWQGGDPMTSSRSCLSSQRTAESTMRALGLSSSFKGCKNVTYDGWDAEVCHCRGHKCNTGSSIAAPPSSLLALCCVALWATTQWAVVRAWVDFV